MVHLGEYFVPAHFMPPRGANPGDTVVLIFGDVAVQVRLPEDMLPGRPVLVAHPNILGLLPLHRARAMEREAISETFELEEEDEENQRFSCERLSRVAVIVLGCGGFIMGITILITKLIDEMSTSGYRLCVILLMIGIGLFVVVERRLQKALLTYDLEGPGIAGAILSSSGSLCSAVVQAVINHRRHANFTLVLFCAWVVLDVGLTTVFLIYMVSLKRFGTIGRKIQRQFLPWFALGGQCIVVLWTGLVLRIDEHGPNQVALSVGQCILGGAAILVGCSAQWLLSGPANSFSGESPGVDKLVWLPGVMTSLTVISMAALCIVVVVNPHNKSIAGPQTLGFAVGIVIVLMIASQPGIDRRSGMLAQAACFVALTGIAMASPEDVRRWHWLICMIAALSSRWPAIFASIGIIDGEAGEAEESLKEMLLTTNDGGGRSDRLTESENGKWLIAMVRNRVGIVYTKARRRAADNIRLAGAILMGAFLAARDALDAGGKGNDGKMTNFPLTLIVPMAILCLHISVLPPGYDSWDAFQVSMLGLAVSVLPYRITLSVLDINVAKSVDKPDEKHLRHKRAREDDVMFEAALFLCPFALLVAVHLRSLMSSCSGSSQSTPCLSFFVPVAPSALLGLALYERLMPVALLPLTAAAFMLAWWRQSLTGMAASIFVLELRGGLSAWCISSHDPIPLDWPVVVEESLAFIVGLGTLMLLAPVSLINTPDLAGGFLLLLLVPVPSLLAPVFSGACWIPGLFAVLYTTMRINWLSMVVAPVVVLVSVGAWECLGDRDNDRAYGPSPVQVTCGGAAAASVSAVLLAGVASRHKSINGEARPLAVISSWGMALLLSVPGSQTGRKASGKLFDDDSGYWRFLALVQVAALTLAMLRRRPPLLHVWYLLPGSWACAALLAGAEFRAAIAVTMIIGAVLMVLPWTLHCSPKDDLPRFADQLLGNADAKSFKRVEPMGMLWFAVGAGAGEFLNVAETMMFEHQARDKRTQQLWRYGTIVMLGLASAVQLAAGLFIHRKQRWRLVSSILMSSLTVFLAALQAQSLGAEAWSKILVMSGSVLAIVAAVRMLFVRASFEFHSAASFEDNEAMASSRSVQRALDRELSSQSASRFHGMVELSTYKEGAIASE